MFFNPKFKPVNGIAIASSINNFALKLFAQLDAKKDENLFVSPFSISTALSMVLSGSANDTLLELKTLLDLNDFKDEQILTMNQEYLKKLSNLNNDQVSLKTANKIFSNIDFELKKEFVENLTKYFLSEIESLNFSNSNESAKNINDWVALQTNNKIKDIISPDSLSNETKLVLLNCIYFKSGWSNEFWKGDTKQTDFHMDDAQTVKVEMMNMVKHFEIKRNIVGLKAQTCKLPYLNHTLSYLIILPDIDSSIDKLKESLKIVSLNSILNSESEYKKVDLSLPKFRMDFKSDILTDIRALGPRLDPTNSDFSRISDDSLEISHIIHQTFISVDEEGTEAAAVTAVSMMLTCCPPREEEIVEFKCDRPFLFLIIDNSDNGILFMGKFVKP